MVQEYVTRLYVPAAHAERTISASSYEPARQLALWKSKVYAAWPNVQVTHVESGGVDTTPQVGDNLHVRAQVELGALAPEDVKVEVVYGKAQTGDQLTQIRRLALTCSSVEPGQPAVFIGTVELASPGSFGYNVRVVPSHPLLATPAELGLIAVAH
jgi:starch phosphorylase